MNTRFYALARGPGGKRSTLAAVTRLLRWSLALVAGGALLHAADSADPELDRVREALRQTMLQLRSTQNDLTTLQTAQAALTAQNKTLTEKYELLRKQATADQATGEKTTAELRVQVATQKATIAQLSEALEKSRTDDARAIQAHLEAEQRNTRLTAQYHALERRVSDLESKNLALFLLGNEILTRYQDFSLGRALAAKEPFVGKTRTTLENLVQTYQDRLLDQRAQR